MTQKQSQIEGCGHYRLPHRNRNGEKKEIIEQNTEIKLKLARPRLFPYAIGNNIIGTDMYKAALPHDKHHEPLIKLRHMG